MRNFSVNDNLQRFILKTSDYEDQFQQLNQDLLTLITPLNLTVNVHLILDRKQDLRNNNYDVITHQTLIVINTTLLKNLLKQQAKSFMVSTNRIKQR